MKHTAVLNPKQETKAPEVGAESIPVFLVEIGIQYNTWTTLGEQNAFLGEQNASCLEQKRIMRRKAAGRFAPMRGAIIPVYEEHQGNRLG